MFSFSFSNKTWFGRVGNAVLNKSTHINDFLSGKELSPECESDVMKYSAVFACIRVLSETLASTSIDEYKKLENGDRNKTNDTGLLELLKYNPNGYMNAFNFHEASMVQLNTDGNFYCLKDKKTKKSDIITSLRPLDSCHVEPKVEKGDIVYKTQDVDGKEKTYTKDQVYHIVGFSSNGIIGLSPLEYFRSIVNVGLNYQNFSENYYKNGIFSTGWFEHDRFLKDDAYKRLDKSLKTRYTGQQKSGTPMLLEDGLKFHQMSIKPIDAQLLESRKFAVEDVCRVYRVPLHLVQNLDKATFSNIEHQSLEFVMYTMLPWFKRIEMSINSQLLTREQRGQGYYFEFNIQSLLRGDSKAMAEAFATGRQWGWLSVNDIRRMLNMNRIENGDRYLEPLNMVEAGSDRGKTNNVKNELMSEISNLIEESKRND